MDNSVVPVQSHACIYRQLRPASEYTRFRNSTRTAHVTFGRAAEILPILKMKYKEVYVSAFEVELPLTLQGMNQQDRANIIKMILEVAVEIYKKKFPPSTFHFNPRMCSEVHTGGELQAVVNLLAYTAMSSKNETRLQTLKIAIKDSKEVSLLPLVYLYTMADSTVGVMNAYPQSQYKAMNGRVKSGERAVGASDVGVVLKRFSEKLGQASCDALSLKDPRLLLLQDSTHDSFCQPSQYKYVGDSFHLQQQQQQQQSNNPRWLKSYCVDVLGDIYRSVQYDFIQRTKYTPISALGGLENGNAVIQNALVPSVDRGDQSPILSFLSVVRNCVDAMETAVSDIISAHFLSEDLIPHPLHFHRHVLPSLYNSQHLEEAKDTLFNFRNADAAALTMNCNVTFLLSAQTKKKARLASLLYKSEEASRRLENPPRNTRNMKEFEEPKTLQRKIEENGEVNMTFLDDVSQIFGAHDNDFGLASSGPPSQPQYAADVESLAGVRLETMEPVGPSVGIHTGLSGDCGAESGGLPPNDLQHFIRTLCAQKAMKSKKRKMVHAMLSRTALTTVALFVEELATEMVLSWKQKIANHTVAHESPAAPVATSPAPSPSGTRTTDDSDTPFSRGNENRTKATSGQKRQRDSTLSTSSYSSPTPSPSLFVPSPTRSVSLPPLLSYDADTFSREVGLQLQGADLDGEGDPSTGTSAAEVGVEAVLRNRMEILFGEREVNTPANIALMHSQVVAESSRQRHEDEELACFFREECKHTKESHPKKRYKFNVQK